MGVGWDRASRILGICRGTMCRRRCCRSRRFRNECRVVRGRGCRCFFMPADWFSAGLEVWRLFLSNAKRSVRPSDSHLLPRQGDTSPHSPPAQGKKKAKKIEEEEYETPQNGLRRTKTHIPIAMHDTLSSKLSPYLLIAIHQHRYHTTVYCAHRLSAIYSFLVLYFRPFPLPARVASFYVVFFALRRCLVLDWFFEPFRLPLQRRPVFPFRTLCIITVLSLSFGLFFSLSLPLSHVGSVRSGFLFFILPSSLSLVDFVPGPSSH